MRTHTHIRFANGSSSAWMSGCSGEPRAGEREREREREDNERCSFPLPKCIFCVFSLSVSLRIPSSLVTMATACFPPFSLPSYPAFTLTRFSVTMAMVLPIMIPVHSFFVFSALFREVASVCHCVCLLLYLKACCLFVCLSACLFKLICWFSISLILFKQHH